jgi:DNA polymerase
MGLAELFDQLHAIGASLELDGDGLYLDGPEDLPSDLIKALRAHKPALLADLAKVRLDLETASRLAIDDVGASAYAEHPSTRVLLLTYCIGDGVIQVWRPGQPMPEALCVALARGGPMVAHGAQFDQAIWQVHMPPLGWPTLSWGRWSCTSIRARLVRLPAGLKEIAATLDLPVQKDEEGARLMRALARTAYRGAGGVEPTEAQLDRLAEYSRIDTEVLRRIDRLLPEPDAATRAAIDLDHIMNRRGLPVDLDLARKLNIVRDAENKRLVECMREISGGRVTSPTQVLKIQALLEEQGVKLPDARRKTLEEWLEKRPDADGLPAQVVRIRCEYAHTADAKLRRILIEAEASGLVRDGFIVFGAHTLRWSGKGVQPQNLPRGNLEDVDATLQRLSAAAESGHPARVPDDGSRDAQLPVKEQIAGCLRACFQAPEGEVFVRADLLQIEARVLAWLAGAQRRLEILADPTRDIYVETATALGSKDRQFGKLAELALGFSGGEQALLQKAPIYGVTLTPEQAIKTVIDWRAAEPEIVRLWDQLYEAFVAAVDLPLGAPPIRVGRWLQVRRTEGAVRIALPSGRDLIYRNPHYAPDDKFGGRRMVLTVLLPEKGKLKAKKVWRGLLIENVVQAIAFDLIVGNMLTLHYADARIVGTNHDEIIALTAEAAAPALFQHMIDVLSMPPAWAEGLPLAADGFINRRYVKPPKGETAKPAHTPTPPTSAEPVSTQERPTSAESTPASEPPALVPSASAEAGPAPLPSASAERWMNCPGSIRALAGMSVPGSTTAGANVLRLLIKCLAEGAALETLTDEPALHAQLTAAIDQARTVIAGRAVLLGHTLPPLPDLPRVWSTPVCIVFASDRVVGVIGFKFGVKALVEPTTPQLAIPVLLAARHFGMAIDGVTVTVIHPQLKLTRKHLYSPAALDRFEQKLRAAVAAVEQPDPPRHAGAWCRFCPAAGGCPEYQQMLRAPEPSIWRFARARLHVGGNGSPTPDPNIR